MIVLLDSILRFTLKLNMIFLGKRQLYVYGKLKLSRKNSIIYVHLLLHIYMGMGQNPGT